MRVIAASEIRGGAELSDKQLKAALGRFIEPPRRIERLILQALLGAAPLKPHLERDCGLYLAASYPCRPNMQGLLETICVGERQPKPFEFVNSVSNAAGFHVAQRLELEGPNLFIGAGTDAWANLLELAALDLQDGLIERALLIHCDNPDAFVVRALVLQASEQPLPTGDFSELSRAIEVFRLDLDAELTA
jgi:hypothetical protein